MMIDYTDQVRELVEACENAIETYGKAPQMIVAIEELSELIKELTKNLRGANNIDHISEEMADVHIMLLQLQIMFSNGRDIRGWRDKKIERLKNRLHNDGSNNE